MECNNEYAYANMHTCMYERIFFFFFYPNPQTLNKAHELLEKVNIRENRERGNLNLNLNVREELEKKEAKRVYMYIYKMHKFEKKKK